MSKVKRVYVEKKKPYAVKAKELTEDIKGYLGIDGLKEVRELVRYDVENLTEDTYKKALTCVFSEPPVDDVYEMQFESGSDDYVFSVEYLPGQFDQRADSAEQCVKFFNENEKDKYFYFYIIFVSSSFSENASFTLMIGFLSTSPMIRNTTRKIQSFPRSIQ